MVDQVVHCDESLMVSSARVWGGGPGEPQTLFDCLPTLRGVFGDMSPCRNAFRQFRQDKKTLFDVRHLPTRADETEWTIANDTSFVFIASSR